MKINWYIKKFNELSTAEFHDIIQLRLAVFVVEQDCVYQDLDGKDRTALHIIGRNEEDAIVATARILHENSKKVIIGRVVVEKKFRKYGLGKELMKQSISDIIRLYGNIQINIAAQKYLLNFYSSLGFVSSGKEYLEDGIPHVEMNLNL
ncbi:MAG: GNAT family N-acetyltransferase [Bacteroidota bacterium]|nr:GNAT family N-acetyltransferase [Bacteroidota bacterium]MEC8968214.1 GNAT family N-acetyltransferase [Bacteroidota bacterium]|tara:strand:+ start:126 stop:572 length:447 start_codon:yes stop_codon:yes gene_type:complete